MNTKEKIADLAMNAGPGYLVIKGFTVDGKRFRPSDWVERLATAVGQCGADRRVKFHPRVRIAAVDGERCLFVDLVLQDEDPLLFKFLEQFAQNNHLQTERKMHFGQEGKQHLRIS